MTDPAPAIDVPTAFVTLRHPFPHLFEALQGNGPVRIVAIGSSSTAGRGDVVPYPHRLEMNLRAHYHDRFPDLRIDVLNRGQGGQEAVEEVRRFDADVFAEDPSLVIWQVGTNAVFHGYKIKEVADAITAGIARIRVRRMDVMLIDPQYVTAMLRDDKADASAEMVASIAAIASSAEVNLFQRWALMRHWHVHNDVALAQMLDPSDPDKLHQNDWSTMEVSRVLSTAITKALAAVA